MKPPHIPGETSWALEIKQAIGDKLRKAYGAAALSSEKNARQVHGFSSHGEDRRKPTTEDPIRRVMFLGPWGHT
ncbi:hypothetical protein FCM35_KLT04134 [Carex littledalei]|uniref:Uncharacterized protein n=1 Tax=Carex littledalei TaxID=544730 RepID=A0A833VL03_9POAL|nr:hypothetical protein FCM35_KLT04134 [Carex littledalei]